MGADIHLYVEKLIEGAWRAVVPPERDLEQWPLTEEEHKTWTNEKRQRSPFWGPFGCMYEHDCYGTYDRATEEEIPCKGASCPKCLGTGRGIRWYRNRNYEVFGILASVRRDDLKPIRKARGCPKDASEVVRDHHSWEHTPSWLTVYEVMTYPWDEGSRHRGLVTVFKEESGFGFGAESFEEWMQRCDGKGSPLGYCQGMGGTLVTVEAAKQLVTAKPRPKLSHDSNARPIVWVEWTESRRESCKDFIAFVTTFIEPLLGEEFASVKAVVGDLLEQERRSNAGYDADGDLSWLTAKTKDKRVAGLREQARQIASTVRFVFGFDS